MLQPVFCYLNRFPLMTGHFPLIQWYSMKCLKFYNTSEFQTNICVNLLGVCCHISMVKFRVIHLLSNFILWLMFLLGLFPPHLPYMPVSPHAHPSNWAGYWQLRTQNGSIANNTLLWGVFLSQSVSVIY